MVHIKDEIGLADGSLNRPLCPDAAFDVVAIAASAGGIPALHQILAALPQDFPAAIVVQTHLPPTAPSLLAEVLAFRSSLPVVWAEYGERLRPGCVTVPPSGQHLRVGAGGVVSLTSWEQLGGIKPHANGLFRSVATSFGSRALGVVLTGYLRDGAEGACAIAQCGGRVLVEDPSTAQVPEMPRATLGTGCVDFMLPLPALTAALISLVMVPAAAHFFAVPRSSPAQPYRDALRMWHSATSIDALPLHISAVNDPGGGIIGNEMR